MENTNDLIKMFFNDVEEQKKILGLNEDQEEKLEQELLSENAAVREDAINKVFLLNAKLIMFFARGYLNKGYSAEDIISNGSIGLLEGIKRFDCTKEYKLSTYVGWYIKKYILKYIEEYDMIRVPSYLNNDYIKYMKTKEQLSIDLGRVAEDKEVAEALGIDMEQLDKIVNCKYSITSLDMKLSDEDGDSDTLADILPDEKNYDIIEDMNREDLKKALNLVMEDLLPNEREIIEYRFGLNDQPTLTLNLIGEKMGLSSERIRQLENSALRKLRNQARKKILQPYL